MNVEVKPRPVYLFRMFLEHDQTRATSISYNFPYLWAIKHLARRRTETFAHEKHSDIDSFLPLRNLQLTPFLLGDLATVI